ncbi:MAG TPA: M20 family metallo-hydrolase [Rectinemataceae bacterium]|nr:M20 family metallo-hydrolase [Rectinemataceae bacterium]
MSDKDIVFKHIEGSTAGIVELESLLTAIPAIAPESGGDGEMKKAEALVAWLAKKGISRIERYDAPDARVSAGKRPNLVATIEGESDRGRVWLMSHLDVVPEGDRSMWKSDPFTVVRKDDTLIGRGVEDNQQGLVSSVFAALAFIENKIKPKRTIKLLFVADEEVGSKYGIQHVLTVPGLFRKDDLIVIPDGGSVDGTDIEVAEKNILWLKVVTKGKQTHASMPDQGANAFLAACDLALRVHALENEVYTARDKLFEPDRSTINPTKKEANVPNVNTIPGDDVFCFDMRILPQYPLDGVLAELGKKMREVEAKYGVKISHEILQRNESKATKSDAPVVVELSKAIRSVYGVQAKAIGIGGGTVGAYLRNAGYDCVVWSRLDETAHQPNESAKIGNIIGDAKVFAALIQGD